MYPSMPQNPVPVMQGANPAQQFDYPMPPMQQGIGGLYPQAGMVPPQLPTANAPPVYMAQGGQPNPMYMADGGQVAAPDKMGLASMIRTGATPEARMAALRQMRGEGPGGFSGKGVLGQGGQQAPTAASVLSSFLSRLGGGADRGAGFSPLYQRAMQRQGAYSGKGQQQGQQRVQGQDRR